MNRFIAIAVAAIFCVTAAACSDDGEGGSPTATAPAADAVTATYGAITNTGGTPVIESDFVLESMTCAEGTFTMATAAGTFVGQMDCTAMPPDLAIAAFVNKPITIQISASRLKIEAIGAGTLDMPVTGAVLEE